jgi:O-antigen/teichoic acid export membrane protein
MNIVQCSMCLVALRPLLIGLPWRCWNPQHLRDLAGYSKYLIIWLLAGTLHPRADRLLLSHYVKENRVLGFYSAAAQLSLIVPMLTQSINLVLLPRISSLRNAAEMQAALRRQAMGALVALAVLLPLALVAGPLVHLIYGQKYEPAIPVFRILLFAAGAELALSPLSNYWHALNRPAMLSVLNVGRLSVLAAVAVFAIPRLGSVGAAWAVLLSTAVPLASQGVILWFIIWRRGRRQQ